MIKLHKRWRIVIKFENERRELYEKEKMRMILLIRCRIWDWKQSCVMWWKAGIVSIVTDVGM